MKIKKNDTVIFIGSSIEQVNWGGNDDPNGILVRGEEYVVEYVEVHTSHTKISLVGYDGKYNSVSFLKK